MRLKGRKIISLLFIICMSLLLMGCRKIDVRSETIINNDESGQIDLYIKYDDILAQYIKGSIFNCEWAENNGYVVRKHTEGSNIVEELVYKFKNIKELEDKMNSSGLVELSHTDKMESNKRTYNFNLVCNKANIEALLSKSIHTGDETKDKYVLNYLENITIHNDIKYRTLKVKASSGVMVNRIDKLDYKLSQLDENISIRFCIQ
ncbi:MAG: hypothetical protein Q4F66_05740 [Clostridium sp.]|nr:hypothetical protein [Clostridium sp.]